MRKHETSVNEKRSRFNRLKGYLLRSHIRPIVHTVFTLGIGGLCSAMGSWDLNTDEFFFIKLFILILAIVFYLCIIAMYATDEKNTKDQLKAAIEAEESRLSDQLTDLLQDELTVIDNISLKLQNLLKAHIISREECDSLFISIYRSICINIKNYLIKYGKGKEFEVLYTDVENKESQLILQTVAFSSTANFKPSQVETPRSTDESDYTDAYLVRRGIITPLCLLSKKEIQAMFAKINRESLDKYTQYCAIPVFNRDGNKLIGLIQIASLNGSKIDEDMESVVKKINMLSVNYSSILQLIREEREFLNEKLRPGNNNGN